jgi:amidase
VFCFLEYIGTRSHLRQDPSILAAFADAVVTIQSLGATIVDPADLPSAGEFARSGNETIVLDVDFKVLHFSSTISHTKV